MAEIFEREAVTAVGGMQWPGLEVVENPQRWLWSVQPGQQDSLVSFSQTLFGAAAQTADVPKADSLRLLRLWPHKALLLSSQAGLPSNTQEFTTMLTDISHGFCEFRLGGEHALAFLGAYCSFDPARQQAEGKHSLRCLLGQYPVLLWWDEVDDIRILVERSLALSFYDYLAVLADRWSHS